MKYTDVLTYRLIPANNHPKCDSDVIYGPIISKRSFHSLGINLWPYGKVCSFECSYCHCGKASESNSKRPIIPLKNLREQIREGFEFHSSKNSFVQDLLVEGNGEPTMYPHFDKATDYLSELRDVYFKNIPLVLFTNSTNLDKQKVIDSVLKYDQAFFKLDGANEETLRKVNNFQGSISQLTANLYRIGRLINTSKYHLKNFEISTAVIGSKQGNMEDLFSNNFSGLITLLNPQKLYLYDIDRDIPGSDNEYKVPFDELKNLGRHIFERTNIETIVLSSNIGRGKHGLSRLNQ